MLEFTISLLKTYEREENVKDAEGIIYQHYHALVPLDVCTSYLSCTLLKECKGFFQLCIFEMSILFEILEVKSEKRKEGKKLK
jgi:hypothetical protein